MKYLHYIFLEEKDVALDEKVIIPAVKIKHSTMWLYAMDMLSLEFLQWLFKYGTNLAKVKPYTIDKVSFNISRKFSIVAFYKQNQCVESVAMETLMIRYWSEHRDTAIPDVIKYLNLNMTQNQQFLCNPNLFMNSACHDPNDN